MRSLFTSFCAFLLSTFAGGMILQAIAEGTHAAEEFILAYMSFMLLSIIVTLVFFIAQLLSNPQSAVSTSGRWLLIVFVVLALAMIALPFVIDGGHIPDTKEVWLLVALTLPPIVTALVHWWFVRWRVGRSQTTTMGTKA